MGCSDRTAGIEANQPIVQILITNTIAVLGFTILGSLAGFLLARQVSIPLVDLSHSANEIAEGNLSVEAKITGRLKFARWLQPSTS